MNLKKVLNGVVVCSALVLLAGCQQETNVVNKNIPSVQQKNPVLTSPSTLQISGSQQFVIPSSLSGADLAAYQDAITKGDTSSCNKIKDAEYNQQCKTALADLAALNAALSKSDSSLCLKISTKEGQDDCRLKIDLKAKDNASAKLYNQAVDNEQKLAASIIAGGDYTACKELKIEGMLNTCELNILSKKAISTKDPSWCDKMTNVDARKTCKDIAKKGV